MKLKSCVSSLFISDIRLLLNFTIHITLLFSHCPLIAKPSKPEGPLEVTDIRKDGCKLSWNKPKDDGGEPIECYVVEKYDPESGVWLPAGKSIKPEIEVTGLTPGHEYKFRVKAVNKEGESEPLETLFPIVAKDPYSKYDRQESFYTFS